MLACLEDARSLILLWRHVWNDLTVFFFLWPFMALILPEPKSVYKWIPVLYLAWKLAFNESCKAVHHLLLNTGCTNFLDQLSEAVAKHFDKTASFKNI